MEQTNCMTLTLLFMDIELKWSISSLSSDTLKKFQYRNDAGRP